VDIGGAAPIQRLYVIGAGASVPYGLPTLKSLTWELVESMDSERRGLLLTVIREAYGRDVKSPSDSPDFEELLSRLDRRSLSYLEGTGLGGPDSPRHRAEEVALDQLRRFIRERCQRIADQLGPYDRLIHSLRPGEVIVSFNWDVLLETAFLRAGRSFTYLPSERTRDGEAVLLKPHGSINWFALLDREGLEISTASNLRPVGDDLSLYLLYLSEPLSEPNFAGCSSMVRACLSRTPAIVPPTTSKLLAVGGQPRDGFVEHGHTRAMKSIWARFKAALEEATEVVAIGYSLPGTDASSIALMKFFSERTVSNRRLLLVEPNSAVADRYRSILGIEPTIICNDFKDFDPTA
jgi:hypothetical protein